MLLSCLNSSQQWLFITVGKKKHQTKSLAMLYKVTCDISLSVFFIAYHDPHSHHSTIVTFLSSKISSIYFLFIISNFSLARSFSKYLHGHPFLFRSKLKCH